MTYSSCLHDQQDLCWGNTSRDTSEESQESQEKDMNIGDLENDYFLDEWIYYLLHYYFFIICVFK